MFWAKKVDLTIGLNSFFHFQPKNNVLLVQNHRTVCQTLTYLTSVQLQFTSGLQDSPLLFDNSLTVFPRFQPFHHMFLSGVLTVPFKRAWALIRHTAVQ